MLTLAGIDVDGISIGGLETCIDLPGLKVAFDMGRAPDFAVARLRGSNAPTPGSAQRDDDPIAMRCST
jgi:hypothetical protein